MNNIEAFYLNARTSLRVDTGSTTSGGKQNAARPATPPAPLLTHSPQISMPTPKGGEAERIPYDHKTSEK